MKNIKTFYHNHKDTIFMVMILLALFLLLMTVGFAIYKMIYFLSDFLVVMLLTYISYILTKIYNKKDG